MPTTYKFKTQASEASWKFVAAAMLPLNIEFETPRNITAGAENILSTAHEHIANVQIDGTYVVPPAPAAPTGLISSLVATTTFALTWDGMPRATSYDVYKNGVLYENVTTTHSHITGLTAGTVYSMTVVAQNGTGDSAASDAKSVTTLETAGVPASSPMSQLLTYIRTAILEITDAGAAIFTGANVVIGELNDFDSRQTSGYPCVEIIAGSVGGSGENYDSQRQITGRYAVRIFLHTYAETVSRVTGTDITSLSLRGSAILRQLYRFVDRAAAGNSPCDGFFLTEPEFRATPYYEEFGEHINTEVIEISFRVDQTDTAI